MFFGKQKFHVKQLRHLRHPLYTPGSLLRNKFLNAKSDIDRKAYNKQCNLCVSLISSEKKNFFSNINKCDITDNKNFWKTVKPVFTDKIKIKSKIILIEKKFSPRKVKRKQFQKK